MTRFQHRAPRVPAAASVESRTVTALTNVTMGIDLPSSGSRRRPGQLPVNHRQPRLTRRADPSDTGSSIRCRPALRCLPPISGFVVRFVAIRRTLDRNAGRAHRKLGPEIHCGQVALVAALTALLVLSACAAPDRYQAVLEGLNVPDGWELATTHVTGSGGDEDCAFFLPDCPRVARYYLGPARPADAYDEAQQMIAAADFNLDEEFTADCSGRVGEPACSLVASQGSDEIQVVVYNPGDDDGLGIAQPDRSTIRVTAQSK
jgi:hypothetical protein